MNELDIITTFQDRRRNATHDINGVIAWLENQAAIFRRDRGLGRHTPETLADTLDSRAAKLRRAVEELHRP